MAPRRDGGGAGAGAGGTGDPDVSEPTIFGQTASQNTVPALSTPRKGQTAPYIEASGSLTRRITRSMIKDDTDATFNSATRSSTRLQERLRNSTSSAGERSTRPSNLENAPSIKYEHGVRGNIVSPESSRATIVALRPTWPLEAAEQPTRSLKRTAANRSIRASPATRGRSRNKAVKGSSRGSTPSDAVSNGDGEADGPCKKRKLDAKPRKLPLRRSARLSKPLTTFHKYPELPNEIKMMIWEAAIDPRIVYLRNRYAHPQTLYPQVQNKVPSWFMTCRLSAKIALQNYRSIFPIPTESGLFVRQPVNLDTDIVVLEPCCNGCRARNCATRNFTSEDRAAVRRLAVQTESPYLMQSVPPCWSSISDIWPNVETIYLMSTATKGHDRREKAMIRIDETPYEKGLRKRFAEWKKGEGNARTVQALEFVTVVEKESHIPLLKDRYKSIEYYRKTDLSEDIIIG